VESVSPALDGAWRRTFSETIGPDGSPYPGRTHESFLLISGGSYSMNWALGPEASDYYAEHFAGVRYVSRWERISRQADAR